MRDLEIVGKKCFKYSTEAVAAAAATVDAPSAVAAPTAEYTCIAAF